DFEHVRVVPVARTGIAGQPSLLLGDRVDAVPVGRDVAGGAPQVGADARPGGPFPRGIPTVLAHREHDRPAGGAQGVVHGAVGGDHQPHLLVGIVRRPGLHHVLDVAAQVVLEVVDAPAGIG